MRQEQRRLAAILAADMVGYSRLMATNESDTLARLRRLRAEVFEPKIAEFHGRIVGSAGDSLLIEFARQHHQHGAATRALEQRQTDRPEAAATTEARLVDPHETADRGAGARFGDV